MQIGRKDLLWNYASTSMRLLSSIVVLPLSLHLLSSQEMGIWAVFLSLMAITSLLDFGFSNSFSRNVSYVYSGVKELKETGYVATDSVGVNYGLLKNLLLAMKRYYGLMAILFLLFFVVISPFYLSSILAQYSGERQEIWIAWFILGGALSYELYTYCYNTILVGRGLVKRTMQITVLSQSLRILFTIAFLLYGLGIISLVLGLLIGNLVNRTLAHRAFYDKDTKVNLAKESATSGWNTIKILAPNSLKVGLISLSAFLRTRCIALIAPFYLSLSQLGEYGISSQAISVISALGLSWFYTFYSQTAQYRVKEEVAGTKRLYIKGMLNLIFMFIIGGGALLLFGSYILQVIKSNTSLLCNPYLFLMLLFSFLEARQTLANGTLLAKNEVPFFKADLVSGICAVLLLLFLFHFTSLGVLGLILSSGLVMCAYMNWKVPFTLEKEIHLKINDYFLILKTYFKVKPMLYVCQLGLESPKELIVHRINKLIYGTKKAHEMKRAKQYKSIEEKYLKNNVWDFNGIKLPKWPKSFSPEELMTGIFYDTLLVYCHFKDNYNSKLVDKLDLILPEGTYGYQNDQLDVTVKRGDIVIDAGAYIGDFSAYAAVKGAVTYAFEPCEATLHYLKMTQQLNENIHIVNKGLGDKSEFSYLERCDTNFGANQISRDSQNAERIEMTTIDDFVLAEKLERVDFIKADIEGFERYMLQGAKETLKKFAPKLAICTYHLPDDPQLLANLITEANPNYVIVQKKSKLYAAVK